MAVIINELEIDLERPPAPEPASQPPAPAGPQMQPQDVIAIVERHARSQLRLLAH